MDVRKTYDVIKEIFQLEEKAESRGLTDDEVICHHNLIEQLPRFLTREEFIRYHHFLIRDKDGYVSKTVEQYKKSIRVRVIDTLRKFNLGDLIDDCITP